MNIPQAEIITLLQQLAEHENIRICAKQSALIGGITGLSALFGGLAGGRNGALAGAAIGTVLSGMFVDEYVSVTHVIRNEMNAAQRRNLLQSSLNLLVKLPGPITLYTILSNKSVSSALISLLQSSIRCAGFVV